jgi:hypothetical protein
MNHPGIIDVGVTRTMHVVSNLIQGTGQIKSSRNFLERMSFWIHSLNHPLNSRRISAIGWRGGLCITSNFGVVLCSLRRYRRQRAGR